MIRNEAVFSLCIVVFILQGCDPPQRANTAPPSSSANAFQQSNSPPVVPSQPAAESNPSPPGSSPPPATISPPANQSKVVASSAPVMSTAPSNPRRSEHYTQLRNQQIRRIEQLASGAQSSRSKIERQQLERGEKVYLPVLTPPFREGEVGYLPPFSARVLNVLGSDKLLVGWDDGTSLIPFLLTGYSTQGVATGLNLRFGDDLAVISGSLDYQSLLGGSNTAVMIELVSTSEAQVLKEDLAKEFQEKKSEKLQTSQMRAASQDPEKAAESQLKLAKQLLESGKRSGAKRFLEKVVSDYEGTVAAEEAAELLKGLE